MDEDYFVIDVIEFQNDVRIRIATDQQEVGAVVLTEDNLISLVRFLKTQVPPKSFERLFKE